MKRRTKILLLVVGIVVFAAGGISAVMSEKPKKTTQTENPAPGIAKSGIYTEYRTGIVEETPGRKVLFFRDLKTGASKAIDEDIEQLGVPPNVTIIAVDYASNNYLRQRYGVTTPATFVEVDDIGAREGMYVATATPSFAAVKKNLLGIQ